MATDNRIQSEKDENRVIFWAIMAVIAVAVLAYAAYAALYRTGNYSEPVFDQSAASGAGYDSTNPTTTTNQPSQ